MSDLKPVGPTEAARRLGVSTRTVQRWLREGRLPSIKVGGRLKVDPSAFADAEAPPPWVMAPPPNSEEANIGEARDRKPIRRLLVANRGELVVRIARTCRELGVTCVALVASDQRSAWWTRQADEQVELEGSYLDADAVLRAARVAEVDAIHPGYGFLAENAAFAEAVEAAGIRWVGPPAAAMRALGDKAAGRRLAISVGVPVVAGYNGEDQSDDALGWNAAAIGYPVLVKPSAGGGGKGMHAVQYAGELRDMLATARREARAAFGDERLILEHLVEEPRHVEVQFLADAHGNAVHLGERDCSLQRRHQKVVEEAPSPAVDADLRARLGDAALKLVRAAGYVGAGTAEFLIDQDSAFSFLEVNARLQVEHPVTEAVTGRDLVADQLRIAAGDELGFAQQDVEWHGHAMEARIYAEDPWSDFLPTVGSLVNLDWPTGTGIRVDAGVGAGDVVGTRYDPLLAKIVSFGNDRAQALERLEAALTSTSLLGVTTNRGFLRAIVAEPEFREGRVTTSLIERAWQPQGEPTIDAAWEVAAAALAPGQRAASTASVPHGFRLNAPPRLRVAIGEEERSTPIVPGATGLLAWASDPSWPPEAAAVFVDVDGLSVRAVVATPPSVETALSHAQRQESGASSVTAPMPGTIVGMRVREGDAVEAGQVLVILEAMKMENTVTAPAAGTVARVAVEPGRQVGRGEILVELR
jgi:excisionase family DNA binding protein